MGSKLISSKKVVLGFQVVEKIRIKKRNKKFFFSEIILMLYFFKQKINKKLNKLNITEINLPQSNTIKKIKTNDKMHKIKNIILFLLKILIFLKKTTKGQKDKKIKKIYLIRNSNLKFLKFI